MSYIILYFKIRSASCEKNRISSVDIFSSHTWIRTKFFVSMVYVQGRCTDVHNLHFIYVPLRWTQYTHKIHASSTGNRALIHRKRKSFTHPIYCKKKIRESYLILHRFLRERAYLRIHYVTYWGIETTNSLYWILLIKHQPIF